MLYLAERVGLWNLLRDMLAPDPTNRISSFEALKTYNVIMDNLLSGVIASREKVDGIFFDSVVSSLEVCTIPDSSILNFSSSELEMATSYNVNTIPKMSKESQLPQSLTLPRPLHYIATFERGKSLGLILSEADGSSLDEEDDEMKETRMAWEEATQDAKKGEVFVRHVVQGAQADQMGVIEVGDRLVGVGEFPFFNAGFEGFLQMLDKVPQRAKNIKIHFDRLSKVTQNRSKILSGETYLNVVSQGVWSTKGRRKSNEDTFILQEIFDNEKHSILVAGIFDGHGGDAAAKTSSQILPSFLSVQLSSEISLSRALQSAWDATCETYRDGCSIHGECVAEYDPREGIIMAGTGSKDLVAGTTASVGAVCHDKNELIVLNCGDSRTLVVGDPKDPSLKSCVHFVTVDHSPSCEMEAARLRVGIQEGLDYSLPQCSVNRWWVKVGDYQYSVSRSLEGTFTTSKGIVSDADISKISLKSVQEERANAMMIIASDGVFEVLDNEQVGREALKMRKDGLTAKDTAKQICRLALNKNTSDNVSAVVVFFQ